MSRCADTKIGNEFIRGISGGERKRCSIGVELLTNPSLLFLDEPTTGLDSATAFNVIQLLRNLAMQGRTIISTIHQPSSAIYKSFDKLILICEGNVIYQGESAKAIDFFKGVGFSCGLHENPSDYFMKLMNTEGLLIEQMLSSGQIIMVDDNLKGEFQARINKIQEGFQKSIYYKPHDSDGEKEDISYLAESQRASYMLQFWLLFIRNIKNELRNPMDVRMKIVQAIFFGVVGILVYTYVKFLILDGVRTQIYSECKWSSFFPLYEFSFWRCSWVFVNMFTIFIKFL